MSDFIKLFAPKRFFLLAGALLGYSSRVVIRCWWLVIPTFFLTVSVTGFFMGFENLFRIENTWLFLSHFIFSIIPAFNFLAIKESKINADNTTINIGISECINLNEDYLHINLDTQRVTDILEKEIITLNDNTNPFRTGLLKCLVIKKPGFFYLLHDLQNIREGFIKDLRKEVLQSTLLVFRDTKDHKVDFHFLFSNDRYSSKKPFHEFEKAFSIVLQAPTNYDQYILQVARIFCSIHGLSILDILIGSRSFSLAHKVIDDCEKLFKSSFKEIRKMNHLTIPERQTNFEKVWLCEFERYRAIIFLNQEEYNVSLRHLFYAIKLNPFHPYNDYEEYKNAFNKRYVAEVASKTLEIKEELEDSFESDKKSTEEKEREREEILWNNMELMSSMDYVETPTYEDTLKHLIKKSNSVEFNALVEMKLKTAFCDSPVQELIRGEILKYLPKGKKKWNELYQERVPEVLNEFKKVLVIDPEFLLMYTRIGTLLFMQAANEKTKVRYKIKMEEGLALWKEGMDIFTRLGFNIRQKPADES